MVVRFLQQRSLVVSRVAPISPGAQVFWTDTSQEELFDQVAVALIDHCFAGYNSCCFAYGQTGSGKTFSMFGDFGENRGIIPRAGPLCPCHLRRRHRCRLI